MFREERGHRHVRDSTERALHTRPEHRDARFHPPAARRGTSPAAAARLRAPAAEGGDGTRREGTRGGGDTRGQ